MLPRKIVVLGILALFMCPIPALAQVVDTPQMPVQTNPQHIAMIFHKLSGMPINAKAWIKNMKEYREADTFKREVVMQNKARELSETFGLIAPYETIILNSTVQLTPLDSVPSGFLIDSFNGDMIFHIDYLNENFGIQPAGLANMRSIRVDADAARHIWRRTGNGVKARVELRLTAVAEFGEDEPFEFKGIMYWPPMRARIESLRVWSADRKEMLWENKPANTMNKIKSLFHQGPR